MYFYLTPLLDKQAETILSSKVGSNMYVSGFNTSRKDL